MMRNKKVLRWRPPSPNLLGLEIVATVGGDTVVVQPKVDVSAHELGCTAGRPPRPFFEKKSPEG